ncbi:bax inhibitor 1 isoform X1 [Pelodiscus sinensis]|uniref:bax inhibitor 1 isoform X1 n=2 Tax=Pelodiscus sinensis TaxID=13735 RepID=UPI003F6AEB89
MGGLCQQFCCAVPARGCLICLAQSGTAFAPCLAFPRGSAGVQAGSRAPLGAGAERPGLAGEAPQGEGVSDPPAGAMDVFNRNIDFNALFKFSHISASTQQHLKKVYASFALCMFVAAAGAYVNVVTHVIRLNLLSGLGSLGLLIWLTATPHSRETEQKRLGMLAGFAFLTGANLSPLLEMCIAINPSIIPTAFLGTAVIFSCFSLSALYARRRSFLYLGGVLLSGLLLMLLFSVVNIFVGSTWLFTANLYLGLMVMCGFVLFDTQLIIEKAESGDKDYIWHCVDLFLDFINLFRELMILLGMNENKKKKEK